MKDNEAYKAGRNTIPYFLGKLAILILILAIFDFGIGKFLSAYYFRQVSGMQYRTTYAMEKTNADVIILGSSAARHNYDPQIIKGSLNLSTYNAGMDGNSIFYSYAVLKSILKRYSPKVVICDFGYSEFRKDQVDYDRLAVLLPYYKSHPEIRPIVNLKGPYEKIKMLSGIYPFNSMVASVVMGNTGLKKEGELDNEGYAPLSTVWTEPMQDGSAFPIWNIDSNKINTYRSLIRDCKNANVKLYIVCSPLFIKPNYINQSVLLGRSIAEENGVLYFDFSRDSVILQNPALFADVSHLNQNGATIFSNRLIDSLAKKGR